MIMAKPHKAGVCINLTIRCRIYGYCYLVPSLSVGNNGSLSTLGP